MEPKLGKYGTWDMKSKMMRSSNLTEVTRARSVDHRCLFQAMGMSKVDKGVVLGVAQTLGTGYFPAACVRGASFSNPVLGRQRLTTHFAVPWE